MVKIKTGTYFCANYGGRLYYTYVVSNEKEHYINVEHCSIRRDYQRCDHYIDDGIFRLLTPAEIDWFNECIRTDRFTPPPPKKPKTLKLW